MAKTKEPKDKDESLDLVSQLEKMGCSVAKTLKELDPPYYVSTGLFPLDLIVTHNMGITSSAIMVYGKSGTGKTSFALKLMASAQKQSMETFYINTERSINSSLIECFPELDASKVKWLNPENGESALNSIELILRTVKRPVIVLDSVPACLSETQMESQAEDAHMAILARMFNGFMPKAKILLKESEGILILLNQVRDSLKMYSSPISVPGGNAIKFYCDMILEMKTKNEDQIKSDGRIIGHRTHIITVKNRYSMPHQESINTIVYGAGYNDSYDIFDLALSFGLIDQSKAHFKFEDVSFHGQQAFISELEKNNDFKTKIKNKILEVIK